MSDEKFSEANREQLSGAGLRTFINLARLWELSKEAQAYMVCAASERVYSSWCQTALNEESLVLSTSTLMRISAAIGAYGDLRVLYGSDERGLAWLRRPNDDKMFQGAAPMDFLLSGDIERMLDVRRALALQLFSYDGPSFGALLMSAPDEIPDRNDTPHDYKEF
ncbi:MAG: uncharacterized protein K0S56_1092 [Microvirga sp.]|nr:uncharacterized protein [Microvirga sp.]